MSKTRTNSLNQSLAYSSNVRHCRCDPRHETPGHPPLWTRICGDSLVRLSAPANIAGQQRESFLCRLSRPYIAAQSIEFAGGRGALCDRQRDSNGDAVRATKTADDEDGGGAAAAHGGDGAALGGGRWTRWTRWTRRARTAGKQRAAKEGQGAQPAVDQEKKARWRCLGWGWPSEGWTGSRDSRDSRDSRGDGEAETAAKIEGRTRGISLNLRLTYMSCYSYI